MFELHTVESMFAIVCNCLTPWEFDETRLEPVFIILLVFLMGNYPLLCKFFNKICMRCIEPRNRGLPVYSSWYRTDRFIVHKEVLKMKMPTIPTLQSAEPYDAEIKNAEDATKAILQTTPRNAKSIVKSLCRYYHKNKKYHIEAELKCASKLIS